MCSCTVPSCRHPSERGFHLTPGPRIVRGTEPIHRPQSVRKVKKAGNVCPIQCIKYKNQAHPSRRGGDCTSCSGQPRSSYDFACATQLLAAGRVAVAAIVPAKHVVRHCSTKRSGQADLTLARPNLTLFHPILTLIHPILTLIHPNPP